MADSDAVGDVEELMGKDLLLQYEQKGNGDIAEVGMVVVCDCKIYFYSMTENKRISEAPVEEWTDQGFQIGEGDAVPGLELALRHSRLGDVFRVFCASKFAYGFIGRGHSDSTYAATAKVPPIPPNTDLEYHVVIKQHWKDGELHDPLASRFQAEAAKLTDEQQLMTLRQRYNTQQAMTLRKEAGNRWFNAHDFPRAAKAYSRATQIAEGYFQPEKNKQRSLNETVEETTQRLQQEYDKGEREVAEDDRELVDIYVAILNNLAACKLSMKEFLAAKDLCVQVLQISPANSKALLRAAKATLALDSYEECEACLKRLLALPDLDDAVKSAAKIELQKLKKAQSDYKAHTKEMQQRMAAKLFKTNSEASQSNSTPTAAAVVEEHAAETSAGAPSTASAETEKVERVQTAESSSATKEAEPKKIDASFKAATSQIQHSNVVILVGTSLAVVLISCIVAYMYS